MAHQSFKGLCHSAVNVVLRVPGLFIAEAWYRTDPVIIQHQYTSLAKQNVEKSHEIVFHLVHYTALLLSFMLVILPLKKLIYFYLYMLSGLLMIGAHLLSAQYVASEKAEVTRLSIFESEDQMRTLGMFLAVQAVISAFIAYLVDLRNGKKFCLLLLHTAPMLSRIMTTSLSIVEKIHSGSTLLAMLIVVYFIVNNIPVVMDLVKDTMRQLMVAVQLYGWIPFLMALWFKILLPMQFLTFWCVLFGLQLYKYLSIASHPILAEGWLVVLLATIGECCVTPLSLLGLCITVSYVSFVILTITKLFLQGRDALLHTNVMHQGWTEGFTMFLLGIQTGIIELKAGQRAFLMSIVLFIVISSLIQSMFEITDPILLSLGASQNKNVMKHVRAVVLCTLLWIMPLYMTILICQFFDLDFWLMVVISSCVLTSVQVVGSLLVYSLFIYDAIQEKPWENLDDVVYYAKATTRVLEFIVALFVVCYGIVESLFGEWSFVNSSILFVHCYFNVWQRLQVGWKTYLSRREAAAKIQSLPSASKQQLSEHDDVCAICYQELTSAKVTPCKHFFHATCLRKWLYVQDTCPMCHKKLPMVTNTDQETDQGPGWENAQVENEERGSDGVQDVDAERQNIKVNLPEARDDNQMVSGVNTVSHRDDQQGTSGIQSSANFSSLGHCPREHCKVNRKCAGDSESSESSQPVGRYGQKKSCHLNSQMDFHERGASTNVSHEHGDIPER